MNTSYFANLRNIKNPLSISRFTPKWYSGPEYKVLAPSTALLKDYKEGIVNDAEYVGRFNEMLSKLNVKTIYSEIIKLYGEDVTLLCYEKPGDFCHRRLVATWFETELGVIIPELAR